MYLASIDPQALCATHEASAGSEGGKTGAVEMSLSVSLRRVLIPCLFPLLLLACAQKNLYVNDIELQQKWLPFLEDGKTTKEEVKSKLHDPRREYEDGQIWTYSMELKEERAVRIGTSESYAGHYALVLIFDERNVLKRHSLLRYKE
jgi:hypothetical protein